MYILTENGELQKGTALSDHEVEVRAELVKVLHEKICRSSYHGTWDRKNSPENISCEVAANYFITRFTLQMRHGLDLRADLAAAEAANVSPDIDPPAPLTPTAVDDLSF